MSVELVSAERKQTIHTLWVSSQLSITALSKFLKAYAVDGGGAEEVIKLLAKRGCDVPFEQITNKKFLLDTMNEMDAIAPREGTKADKVTKYYWYLAKQSIKVGGKDTGNFELRRKFSPWYLEQVVSYLVTKQIEANEVAEALAKAKKAKAAAAKAKKAAK